MLALTAARPDRDYESVVVGRARPRAASSAQVTVARIRPLGEDPASRQAAALAHLTILLDLYDRGMREPLPIACDTTAAYAAATRTGGDAVAAALEAWASDYDRDREDREPEHTLAFGGQATLTELMSEPPRADEHWERAQPTRFGSYALRLWSPLLAAEECSDL
jgi:exodeoxyribonuclease V gamma subunit